MADLDQLARRVAGLVLVPVDRVRQFTSLVLVFAVMIGVASYLLGIAALSGGVRTVWIVLGAVFGWLSIARLVQQRWRVEQLYRNTDDLVSEIRLLMAREVERDPDVVDTWATDRSDDDVAAAWTRQLMTLDGPDGRERFARTSEAVGLRWIPLAVTTVRRLPFVMLGSIFITGVFGVLALIFLLGLAIG